MDYIDHIYSHDCNKVHVRVEVLTQGSRKRQATVALSEHHKYQLKVTEWKSVTWLAHLIDIHLSMKIDSTLSNTKLEAFL